MRTRSAPRNFNKIFCIGLNKTGTSSLHHAFEILGFSSVHLNCEKGDIKDIIQHNYQNDRELLDGIAEFDAYSDWNRRDTNELYRVFDLQYPNSKFILNTRNVENWLRSRARHVRRIPNLAELQRQFPKNRWYNIDIEAWLNEWNALHASVDAYFAGRPDDLLIIDVSSGEGWDKLCPFLGVPIPNTPFPKVNVTPS